MLRHDSGPNKDYTNGTQVWLEVCFQARRTAQERFFVSMKHWISRTGKLGLSYLHDKNDWVLAGVRTLVGD
jgi:hypothetical protein